MESLVALAGSEAAVMGAVVLEVVVLGAGGSVAAGSVVGPAEVG